MCSHFPARILRLLPLKQNGVIEAASKYIREICGEMIVKKHERLQKNQAAEKDILSVALQSGGFTDDQLVDQVSARVAIAAPIETIC
jgi:hypothetical protein